MIGESSLHSIMGQLPAEVLKFRLRSSMDNIPTERLWGWLLLVASQPSLRVLDRVAGAVSVELERNDDRLKGLVTYGVEWCTSAEDPVCLYAVAREGSVPSKTGRFRAVVC